MNEKDKHGYTEWNMGTLPPERSSARTNMLKTKALVLQ